MELPGITVEGIGEASGRPDMLTVRGGVSVLRPTIAEAMSEAATRAAAIRAAVAAAGVEPDDLSTVQYSVRPRHSERRIDGYEVTDILAVRSRDIGGSGELIAAITKAGGDAAQIHAITLDIEDSTDLQTQARERAWNDAHRKAGQLADLARVALGSARSVVEGDAPSAIPRAAMARSMEMAPQIEGGTHMVTVSLRVTFEIS